MDSRTHAPSEMSHGVPGTVTGGAGAGCGSGDADAGEDGEAAEDEEVGDADAAGVEVSEVDGDVESRAADEVGDGPEAAGPDVPQAVVTAARKAIAVAARVFARIAHPPCVTAGSALMTPLSGGSLQPVR
ncbi:hypothetical protein [Saccharothrix sp. Mg75]|uniref:hypothetical protein n=1 Tax=Saccharothrix sp. Mg75 TaxID=3445357 RepID=UPI003EE8AB12